jgi:hypothetical protein
MAADFIYTDKPLPEQGTTRKLTAAEQRRVRDEGFSCSGATVMYADGRCATRSGCYIPVIRFSNDPIVNKCDTGVSDAAEPTFRR